jgi:hypothetical protein
MSARVETPQIRGSLPVSIVVVTAVVVALGIGVAAGTIITKAVDDSRSAVATSVGAPLWDAQKLDAMQGRAMAERFRSTQPVTWDAAKLEAMAGRVLYQPNAYVGLDAGTLEALAGRVLYQPDPGVQGWDAYKLEAMKGRVLAARAGAEDPPVKPHIPKRPPNG